MASPSPLLMVFSQDTTKVQGGSNQEASKSEQPPKMPRGRKPGKHSNKSPLKQKKPGRGMGVAKLQTILGLDQKSALGSNNIPEVIGFHPPPHHHHQFQAQPFLPVAASPPVYFGSELNMSSFLGPKAVSLGGGACGNVKREWVGGMLETSTNELSSIPKVQCNHNPYEAWCSKTKCMNMEEMGLIIGSGKDHKLVPSMINCHNVLTGLNHGHAVGLELKDFNPRAMRQVYHHQQESDHQLMGFTRSSSVQKEYEFFPPGKSLMEYEFFPGSRTSSHQPHHTEAASSYFIPSDQYNAATSTNHIDLSLKL